jgi:hypothetical protein
MKERQMSNKNEDQTVHLVGKIGLQHYSLYISEQNKIAAEGNIVKTIVPSILVLIE